MFQEVLGVEAFRRCFSQNSFERVVLYAITLLCNAFYFLVLSLAQLRVGMAISSDMKH